MTTNMMIKLSTRHDINQQVILTGFTDYRTALNMHNIRNKWNAILNVASGNADRINQIKLKNRKCEPNTKPHISRNNRTKDTFYFL